MRKIDKLVVVIVTAVISCGWIVSSNLKARNYCEYCGKVIPNHSDIVYVNAGCRMATYHTDCYIYRFAGGHDETCEN